MQNQFIKVKPLQHCLMYCAVCIYQLIWFLCLPLVGVYLWKKGRKEPLYRQFWSERLGFLGAKVHHPIWVHSASMGELRGAAPLIQALLDQKYKILITTLTPAGRTSAQSLFKTAIDSGQLQVSYVPLEQSWAIKSFVRRFKPICAVMTEIDTWPALMMTLHQCRVPLVMANAQYPRKSIERDTQWGGFRAKLFAYYELVMCKSNTHAARFRQVGVVNVAVTGETRFDLPIPQTQLLQAQLARQTLCIATEPSPQTRAVLCIASAVIGEDEQFIEAFKGLQTALKHKGLPKPLLVYVPRSPQRFDEVYALLRNAGFAVARRSDLFNSALELQTAMDAAAFEQVDVLLGDSLREMYFYLALSMVVVVGASFVPLGSHNVIEPLGLKKPVMVGPSIWGIEYPGIEAIAAGVLQQHSTITSLVQAVVDLVTDVPTYVQFKADADAFYQAHAGATQKHIDVLIPWLNARLQLSNPLSKAHNDRQA